LKLKHLRAVLDDYGSPPSRGRGLKPDAQEETPLPGFVAPFTGAWIETAQAYGRREPN